MIQLPPITGDATPAIQAAIDSLPLNTADVGVQSPWLFPTGGKICLATGIYELHSPVKLLRDITLIGDGVFATQFRNCHPGDAFVHDDAGRGPPDTLHLADFAVIQDPNIPATSGAGIRFTGENLSVKAVRWVIERLAIRGTYHGLSLANGIGCSVRNLQIVSCVDAGVLIDFEWSTTSTLLDTVHVQLCLDGFRLLKGAYIKLLACASDKNRRRGYSLIGGSTHSIDTCGAEENDECAVYLEDTIGCDVKVHSANKGSGNRHGIITRRAKNTTIRGSTVTHTDSTGWGIQTFEPVGKTRSESNTFLGSVESNPYSDPPTILG